MRNSEEEGNREVITFTTFSFGCRINEAGFSPELSQPEIYIINTCAVTAKAEQEARKLIYRLKRHHPEAKIVITGCAATYWQKNGLYCNLPVDMIIENSKKQSLVNLLRSSLPDQPQINRSGCQEGVVTSKYIDSRRYLIKIQDGCQRFCSYCIVPYLRGVPKSQTIQSIRKQLLSLYDRTMKVQEIILTAINTEAFGLDTGEKFTDLLKVIIDNTAIPRISCGSINPWSVNDGFIKFYRHYLPKKRFVNFFHIPLQSGSNKILSLMKRGYLKEEFLDKVNSLAKINPMAFFATDVIVGFLDEDEKDFQDTYDFLEKSPISKLHVFRFSKRENTVAFYMTKKLTEPSDLTKRKRSKILSELSKRKYFEFLIKLVNYHSSALFINKIYNNYQETLLDNQVLAWIKTSKNLNGEIRNVKITEFKKGQLFGKIV